jgi:hypothetical protein
MIRSAAVMTVGHSPLDPFGQLNPKAPSELSRFAFLLGRWGCEATLMTATEQRLKYKAFWEGRFILDGYAIADEFRMTTHSGELIVLGMNFRTYNPVGAIWSIKWLDALTGTWADLASEAFGGVQFDDISVTYAFPEPVAEHAYTRARYTICSDDRFIWRGDMSDDGDIWSEFMLVEAMRIE